MAYGEGSFLVFGRESRGLPLGLIEAHANRCVRIPMREGLRSLNLSNAVAVAAYEALRQQDGRDWGRSCRLTQPSKRAFSRFSKIKRAEDVERVYT